jgi:hypothetical protein
MHQARNMANSQHLGGLRIMVQIVRAAIPIGGLVLRALAALFLTGAVAAVAQTQSVDVTARFSQSRSALIKTSADRFTSAVTLRNVSTANIFAPLRMVVEVSPASMTLANWSGLTPDGKPYISVQLLDGYALPQEETSVNLSFTKKNPTANVGYVPITFNIRLFAAPTPAPVTVRILEPIDGSTPTFPRTSVYGTFSGSSGTTVQVNGSPACIFQNRFFLNDLAITTEIRKIIAVGNSLQGGQGQSEIGIYPAHLLSGIQVIPKSPCGGIAPHQTTFSLLLRNIAELEVREIEADLDGDGTTDYRSTDPFQLMAFTYNAPGLYRARFLVHKTGGEMLESISYVAVTDAVESQKPFTDLVTSLKTALNSGNRVHALSYLTGAGQSLYGPVLDDLGTQLPSIMATWSTLTPIWITDRMAVFSLTRVAGTESYTARVVFVKDANGAWKIDGI